MAITSKIGELDLEYLVLYILQNHHNISTSELKSLIRNFAQPSGVNLTPLMNRNDEVIDQIVRNIISHRNDSSNNIINRGLITYSNGLLDITQKGIDALNNHIKQNPLFK